MTNMMQRPKMVAEQKKSAMEDTELLVKINLSVTADFKKCLKAFAASQELTMSSLIVEVMNEHMRNCANDEMRN